MRRGNIFKWVFAARYITNTSFPPQTSYSNTLSFGVYYCFIRSQKIDLREWIRSNPSSVNLSRYCRKSIRPNTVVMRVPQVQVPLYSYGVYMDASMEAIGFTILTSALLSKFDAKFYLYGILIFEFQRAPCSNNLFIEYYVLHNEHKSAPNLFE